MDNANTSQPRAGSKEWIGLAVLALPALLIGVLIAGAIVTAVSCGVISLWV